jgi:hypothetical protein
MVEAETELRFVGDFRFFETLVGSPNPYDSPTFSSSPSMFLS